MKAVSNVFLRRAFLASANNFSHVVRLVSCSLHENQESRFAKMCLLDD
jgi:hypothetical protein